uniref:Odorant receptor n=1 Tax=Anopheles culicifacies TaxID=139723 RepID=A0A182MTZ4_9DIPT
MTLWIYLRQKLSPILDLRKDSDFFVLLDWQYIFNGVQLKTKRRWLRALFLLYQLLLPTQCTIWLYRTWAAAYMEHNTTLALSLFCGQFALTSILFRYLLLLLSYDQLQPIRTYINSRHFLDGHTKAHELRQRAFRTNNILILGLMMYGLINFSIYEACDLQWHEIFRMPNYLVQSNRMLAWTLQIIMHPMTLNGLGAFITSFLSIHTMLTALQAEFLLVEFAFVGLLKRTEEQIRQVPMENDEKEGLLWQSLNRELGRCIREHCEVMKHIREVNRVHSFSITVQYYTALLSLAIDFFFISYYGLDFASLSVLMFSVLLVFEWYYCCKLVEDLQATQNKRIGWILYNDDWPVWLQRGKYHQESLRQFRTTLSIVLLASQQSLSFHGSDIVEVSWQTFAIKPDNVSPYFPLTPQPITILTTFDHHRTNLRIVRVGLELHRTGQHERQLGHVQQCLVVVQPEVVIRNSPAAKYCAASPRPVSGTLRSCFPVAVGEDPASFVPKRCPLRTSGLRK